MSDSANPMDCSPPGSFIHGILQARILEWVAISSSRGSSWPRDQTYISCIAGSFLTHWATREAPSYTGSSQIQWEKRTTQAHVQGDKDYQQSRSTWRLITETSSSPLSQPHIFIYLSHIIINIHYFISSFMQQPTFQDVDLKVPQNNTYEYFSFSKPLSQDI